MSKIVRTEYEVKNGLPVVWYFLREGKKRRVIMDTTTEPYFYILDDEKDLLPGFRISNDTFKSVLGDTLRKITVTLPEDVPMLREKFSKSWEADVTYGNRCTIDYVDKLDYTLPKIIILDIEIDSSGRIPNPLHPVDSIICLSIYDNLEETYTSFAYRNDISPGKTYAQYDGYRLHETRWFSSERDMLKDFVSEFENLEPDVVTGWNVNNFDLPYLFNRMDRLSVKYYSMSPMRKIWLRERDPVIKGVAVVDLLDAYRMLTENQDESYKLDFIAKKELNEGKSDIEANIRFMWKNKIGDLIKYNLNDVRLCRMIDESKGIFSFLDELRRLAFCQLEDTLAASRVSDAYILRTFHNQVVFPTKIHHEKAKFEGAFVGKWANGIQKNVVVFDLRSLYPSIIRTFNLSMETVADADKVKGDPRYIIVDDVASLREPKGLLPKVIESLTVERNKYKEMMVAEEYESTSYKLYNARQEALKRLLNALYGQTAFIGSRIYDPRIAKTTTYMGREIIIWSKDKLEEYGYSALYADTDGLAWSIGEEVDLEAIKFVLGLINESYSELMLKYGITNHHLEMEFEKIYRRMFFGDAKKKYSGHLVYDSGRKVDKIETRGFELRRSDAAQVSRKLQENLFEMLLKKDTDKDGIMRSVGEVIDKIRGGETYKYEEIGIPKGINRELDTYGRLDKQGKIVGIPIQVKGVINAERYLGIELSSKPKMLYVKEVPGFPEDANVLCFDDASQIPPGTVIDVEKMLEKLVKDKVRGVFDALGWKLSALNPYWKGKPKKKGGEQMVMDLA